MIHVVQVDQRQIHVTGHIFNYTDITRQRASIRWVVVDSGHIDGHRVVHAGRNADVVKKAFDRFQSFCRGVVVGPQGHGVAACGKQHREFFLHPPGVIGTRALPISFNVDERIIGVSAVPGTVDIQDQFSVFA